MCNANLQEDTVIGPPAARELFEWPTLGVGGTLTSQSLIRNPQLTVVGNGLLNAVRMMCACRFVGNL